MIISSYRCCPIAVLCLMIFAGSAARAEFEFAGCPWLGKHSVYSTRRIVSTMYSLASQVGIYIMKRGRQYPRRGDRRSFGALGGGGLDGWAGVVAAFISSIGPMTAKSWRSTLAIWPRPESATSRVECSPKGARRWASREPWLVTGWSRRALRPPEFRRSRCVCLGLSRGWFPVDSGRSGHHQLAVRPSRRRAPCSVISSTGPAVRRCIWILRFALPLAIVSRPWGMYWPRSRAGAGPSSAWSTSWPSIRRQGTLPAVRKYALMVMSRDISD